MLRFIGNKNSTFNVRRYYQLMLQWLTTTLIHTYAFWTYWELWFTRNAVILIALLHRATLLVFQQQEKNASVCALRSRSVPQRAVLANSSSPSLHLQA